MKYATLSLAIVALSTSTHLYAAGPNVQGGASNSNVIVGASNLSPLDPNNTGNAGISMERPGGIPSATVDILGAPIKQATNPAFVDPSGNRWAIHPGDGQFIAQVWANTNNTEANIYSLRQVREPNAPMPVFGGLVIGQVKDSAGVSLPVEQGVYFGEWSSQNTPTAFPSGSTNLNMDSDSHTVWYAGDNAVTTSTMPTAINATYAVVGISGVGTAVGGTPDNPNLYSGNLNVDYSGGNGSIAGNIVRGTHAIVFDKTSDLTTFDNTGHFNNVSGSIRGNFYNGANALAGIYTGGATAQDDVAFGGSKISGTITP